MELPGWLSALARHPIITAVLVFCTLAGGWAGAQFLDADWSLARRALAGAVFGGWVGILLTATKMVGQ